MEKQLNRKVVMATAYFISKYGGNYLSFWSMYFLLAHFILRPLADARRRCRWISDSYTHKNLSHGRRPEYALNSLIQRRRNWKNIDTIQLTVKFYEGDDEIYKLKWEENLTRAIILYVSTSSSIDWYHLPIR